MPRGRHLVEETRAGYRPIGKVKLPVEPPRKPADSERSARPPAYRKDRGKNRD